MAPTISSTGDVGAEPIIAGDPDGVTGIADTFHSHFCEAVPLLLVAIAVTFQNPSDALVLVYEASVTFTLDPTGVPLRYQDTLTVWFTVILNVLVAPAISVTGDVGA